MHFASPTRYLSLRLSPLAACTVMALALACLEPAHGHTAAPASTQQRLAMPLDGRQATDFVNALALRNAAHAKAMPAPMQPSTVLVTSCADDGSNGTLRHAALVANPGDVVDLSGLSCSTITLESGAILVAVDDLTFKGPGREALAIDGHNNDRVFIHSGIGTLAIEDLTVEGGRYEGPHAYGGCIYSKGSVSLTRAAVDQCAVIGADKAIGGAIVATSNLTMHSSELVGNMVSVTTGQAATLVAAGGAALVAGELEMHESSISGNTVLTALGKAYAGGALAMSLTAKYSTFSGNQAVSSGGGTDNYSIAGGLASLYSIFLLDTTIDSNSADLAGGAFVANSGFATIVQSTISSNVGHLGVGGIAADADVNLLGSTIAFNSAGSFGGGGILAAGVNFNIESTILADNTPTDFEGAPVVTGSHNLVKVIGVQASAMPPDTIVLDPALGPLVNNGGRTRSHALAAGSVAIDAGSGGTLNLESDQRGTGFKRPVGAAQDIGAVEFDADRIMTNGYE